MHALLSYSVHPALSVCGVIATKLFASKFSRLCEENVDLESVEKLKTHDELSALLAIRETSCCVESMSDESIFDWLNTHLWDHERIVYIKKAKEENQMMNPFFETKEFKALEYQYAEAIKSDCSSHGATLC